MRENKKVLKFRKFKIANLQVSSIVGGTDSNPCVVTEPLEESIHCTSILTLCTEGQAKTGIEHTCTETQNGLSNVSG
ncbi:hypothetical protein H2O64_13280 [Kordia sp. YSTF-M3]|uniref:Uncharacterized protein n=1 Tax=Kordia aestuariivivens TaxID=2759037 RepID=A0ABR7QBE1_9FLAO|nr:hypothetical protein [Kordia aestuariivivens]MBC8755644.1 hypothetical protein [Kordia aestuariivivens]